jgi:hypothetical protein
MTMGSQRDLAFETNARIEYWYGVPILWDRKRTIKVIGTSNAKTHGYTNRTIPLTSFRGLVARRHEIDKGLPVPQNYNVSAITSTP